MIVVIVFVVDIVVLADGMVEILTVFVIIIVVVVVDAMIIVAVVVVIGVFVDSTLDIVIGIISIGIGNNFFFAVNVQK